MNASTISDAPPHVTTNNGRHGIWLDVQSVGEAARGKWPDILRSLGIAVPATAKQHGPCPCCGGKDRFRFDDLEGRGTWFCNQCDPHAGNGFALIQNVFSCDFLHALETVALEIGYRPLSGYQDRHVTKSSNEPAPPLPEGKLGRDLFVYENADGVPVICVQRINLPDGEKTFRQWGRTADGTRWQRNLDHAPKPRPPYRLRAILASIRRLIVIHEGEKACEAAVKAGLLGDHTTTLSGAKNPHYTDFSPLKGHDVVICCDNDASGEEYAQKCVRLCHQAGAKSVRVLLLPGLPPKGDVVEWLDAGGTAEQFAALIEQAEVIKTAPQDADPGSVSVLSVPSSNVWPEIQPVKTDLLPVEPLPLNILPLPFRGWIADVSNRMQCPPDFVAAAMLVMAGAIVGAGCGIRPKKYDDWTVVPNFWGGVVGRPSMLKTPAMGEAMKPLDRLECAAKAAYDMAKKNYDAEYEAYKAHKESLQTDMRKAAKGKAGQSMDNLKVTFVGLKEPDAPVWQRYKTNDATIEKMAELQKDNPRGLLLFRDELIGLFATWDKDGHEADRAFYLESWNGVRPYTSDRIGRGTVFIENLCVSLFGGIQPSKLTGYLHQAMRGCNNDGLVQRLQILVYPDEPRTWQLIDTPVNAHAKEQAYRVVERLASMDFRQHGALGEESQRIPYYRFDANAQAIFNEWLTGLETKLRQDHDEPVLIEHLGKYRSLMPALALLFHVLALADGQPASQVSAESAQRGAAWCEYLESHARRIYGLVTSITAQAASRLANRIQQGALPLKFSVRDVYRKDWSLLDDKQVIEGACEELASLGWLREQIIPAAPGQRGKTEYLINPKVRG
ncbi:MAG: hypothetical protein OJF50_001589 [Nitrospira sp.]|jgi:hypothetical protein|nr:hypothetical protein [Nitrospira sp.]